MKQEDFEMLVAEALENLPENIQKKMENVAIIVQENPTAEQLKQTGVRQGSLLLGLYEGIPQTAWGRGFGGNLPDKITIFQSPIEQFAFNPEEIKKLVKNTVIHEIAHHFGFDEKGAQRVARK
jgi:predicted Zn-dependent protease with MMP-like domain